MQRKTARLPIRPVPRGTLPDKIYRQIRDLILDGGIAPGELVTIQGLAEAFGVSAMPVREALQRLTAERALTVVSGRSVGIPQLAAGRLSDLCRVRLEVETLATVWAASRLRPQDISRLERLVATMAQAVSDGNPRQYVRANHEFHFVVYRASGSETLLSIIEELWLQVSPYFHMLHGSGNYALANREHERLLIALKDQDAAAAGACIRADIEGAAAVLLGLLEREAAEPEAAGRAR
jgi:DNA-binding GntR family transcriptional regulator